jgi:methylenetetrahydrofolate dehydrogenase (NADP+) / methenyltetrahydrofolate cyclohydrolase
MALLLNGKVARDAYKEKLVERIRKLPQAPIMALIQVGDNRESNIYIVQKKKFALAIGAHVEHVHFPAETNPIAVKEKIEELNKRSDVHGIIVQLPLPAHFDKQALIETISPTKDVDGLTNENQTLLDKGTPRLIPATPRGVSILLEHYSISVRGKQAVVFGRSRLVGAPLASLLRTKGASVEVCHSQTPNSKEISKKADLVFVAIGKPEHIDSSYIKEGAVVVDIGINSIEGKLDEEVPRRKLVGDVLFSDVEPHVSAISPVPGGVGPMTVLSLFDNLILSAEGHTKEKPSN